MLLRNLHRTSIQKDQQMPQGLGTGQLYTNNIEMPLAIKKDELWFLKNS